MTAAVAVRGVTRRFGKVVAVDDAKHLFVGFTERVLDEVVRRVNPAALPLPTTYEESA